MSGSGFGCGFAALGTLWRKTNTPPFKGLSIKEAPRPTSNHARCPIARHWPDLAHVSAVHIVMKLALPTLFWLSLTAVAFAADEPPATPVVPQPRVRLVQTVTGATPQVV